MASLGGASVEPEDGRIGIDLCRLGLCGSGENGLRRASATDAIIAGGYRKAVVLKCWAARSRRRFKNFKAVGPRTGCLITAQ